MAMIDKEIQLLMLKGEKGDPGISGDYNELTNKPKINGVELLGNKTASDLGLASEADLSAAVADIATNAANIATNTTNIGALNDLATTVKSSLVAAINEVNADTFSKNVEYGTWTPTINNSAVTVGGTDAIYYRVGRLVYVNARIVISSISGVAPDAPAILRGLPYVIEGSSYAGRNRLFLVNTSNGCITASDYPCVAYWHNGIGSDRTILQVHGGGGAGSGARWVDSTDGIVFLTGVYCTNA